MTAEQTSDGAGAPAPPDTGERLAAHLNRARSGDSGAWNPIVLELNPRLWHLARAQGLAADEAMDVVQVAWLELLRNVGSIRSPRALTAWMITTTKREAWRVAARRRRDRGLDVDGVAEVRDPGPLAEQLVEVAERDQVLWQHVEQLPLRCRELLRLVAGQPRPDYDLIVEALGMPKGSIGPTRGRCLAMLRARLAADPRWSPQ